MSKSDWYGYWIWDYLNHEGNDLADEAWKSYGIWRKAYLKAHPEFSEVGEYELVTEHYDRWTNQLYDSWLFRAWIWFYRPSAIVRQLVWYLRCRLFS